MPASRATAVSVCRPRPPRAISTARVGSRPSREARSIASFSRPSSRSRCSSRSLSSIGRLEDRTPVMIPHTAEIAPPLPAGSRLGGLGGAYAWPVPEPDKPLLLIQARNLITNLALPAFLTDPDGALLLFNDAAAAPLVRPFEEVGRLPR